MSVHEQPDGTIELGDWPYRIDENWLNIVWIATQYCELNCPYCIGWKLGADAPPTLIDKYGVEGCVDRFERIRETSGKNVYLTISGGEPTHIRGFAKLCSSLAGRGFVLELQTNLTTKEFRPWGEVVDPAAVAQVVASYHAWAFAKDPGKLQIYRENFEVASNLGMTPVAKRVVLPREADRPADILRGIQKNLPRFSPVLLWGYIKGIPLSAENHSGAYPYAYTPVQKKALAQARVFRRNCQGLYQDGAGFFRGMKCDAGRGFVYMDIKGDVWRCFTANKKIRIGDFGSGTVALNDSPVKCPYGFCSTPFWGLWFGVNPWDYVPGSTSVGATYCRHYKGDVDA